MKVIVERQERFEKNPKKEIFEVTFKKMLKMIENCHHPLDARALQQVKNGEAGFHFLTDREFEYRITIEK